MVGVQYFDHNCIDTVKQKNDLYHFSWFSLLLAEPLQFNKYLLFKYLDSGRKEIKCNVSHSCIG